MPRKSRQRNSSAKQASADNVYLTNNDAGNILPVGNDVSERLLAYRHKHRLSYLKLATLIEGITPRTVRKAICGGSLSELSLIKINDFLTKVEVSA